MGGPSRLLDYVQSAASRMISRCINAYGTGIVHEWYQWCHTSLNWSPQSPDVYIPLKEEGTAFCLYLHFTQLPDFLSIGAVRKDE